MAEYGALKQLMVMLKAAPSVQAENVAISFGDEMVATNEQSTPCVVLFPSVGRYKKDEPGYGQGTDVDLEMQWYLQQTIELWCWGFDDDPNAQPIDHANATENLRAAVLQALWSQRRQGLAFDAISEQWRIPPNEWAVNRQGRALVITVLCDVTIKYLQPDEATVTSTPTTVSIQ